MKKHTITLPKILGLLWFCLCYYSMTSFAQPFEDPLDVFEDPLNSFENFIIPSPPSSEETINCPPTDYVNINILDRTTITIDWGAVSNANSYDVMIYINGSISYITTVYPPSTTLIYYPIPALVDGDTITICITPYCYEELGKSQISNTRCRSVIYRTSLATVKPVYKTNGQINICNTLSLNPCVVSFNSLKEVCLPDIDLEKILDPQEDYYYNIESICNCIKTSLTGDSDCENLINCLSNYDYPLQTDKETKCESGSGKQVIPSSNIIHPNPVKNNCTFQYQLTTNSTVSLQIFTLSGIKLFEAQQEQITGQQVWQLPTSDIPTGLHYYLLNINGKIQQGKFLKIE